jgi:hypothetical protein
VNRPAALLAGALLPGALVIGLITAPAADARSARPAQRLHVSSTRHVVAPSTLRPGLVDLRNTRRASVYIVRKKRWGVSTFVADYNSPTGAAYERHFTSIAHLYGHRDAYVPLSRGTYYLVDGDLNQITAAQVKTVTVAGRTWNAPRPASRRVTISGRHNRLTAPATLPTRRYLHVVNETPRTQWVILYRIGSGTSAAALRAFVAHPSMTRLGRLDLRSVQYPFLGSGHRSLYYDLHAARGRYLLITLGFPARSDHPQFGAGQAVAITVG